jgi:SAM-dependent methyltransferase
MLHYLVETENFSKSEGLYLNAREKEGRFFTDLELKKLPLVSPNHPYVHEWKLRAKSLRIIVDYLRSKSKEARSTLLEIGCGNGWVAHQLQKEGFAVSAMDVNSKELEQAARVFPDVNFYYADIFDAELLGKFDVIILMASLQYFEDPEKLIQWLKQKHLNPRGEIIIADTMFYHPNELGNAKQRSSEYYNKIGTPEMADYYFHHTRHFLNAFSYKALKKSTIFENLAKVFGLSCHPFEIYVIH